MAWILNKQPTDGSDSALPRWANTPDTTSFDPNKVDPYRTNVPMDFTNMGESGDTVGWVDRNTGLLLSSNGSQGLIDGNPGALGGTSFDQFMNLGGKVGDWMAASKDPSLAGPIVQRLRQYNIDNPISDNNWGDGLFGGALNAFDKASPYINSAMLAYAGGGALSGAMGAGAAGAGTEMGSLGTDTWGAGFGSAFQGGEGAAAAGGGSSVIGQAIPGITDAGAGGSGSSNLFNLDNFIKGGSNGMTDWTSQLFPQTSSYAPVDTSMFTDMTAPQAAGASLFNPNGFTDLSNSGQFMNGAATSSGAGGGGFDLNSFLGQNGNDIFKALASYGMNSSAAGNFNQAGQTAAQLNNPLYDPQRLPFQANLYNLVANPSQFLSSNPLALAGEDRAKQAFQASSAKMGMGGTTINDYMRNIQNNAASSYNDQFKNLMTAGGFDKGTTGGGNAASSLLGAGAGAQSNVGQGFLTLLNNPAISNAGGQAIQKVGSSVSDAISTLFS